MAVATEVAWRAPPGATGGNQMQLPTAGVGAGQQPMVVPAAAAAVAAGPGVVVVGANTKVPAWSADTQKLMHLMLPRQWSDIGFTLDLLGSSTGAGGGGGGVVREEQAGLIDEILEVNRDHPLPTGWDQCLNLKTGEFYFVNRITAQQTTEDPRKFRLRAAEAKLGLGVIAPAPAPAPACSAQDFLPTKKEETRRENSTPPASTGDVPPKDMPPQQQKIVQRHWSVENVERISEDRMRVTWLGQLANQEIPEVVAPTEAVVDKQQPPVQGFTSSPCDESHLELNLNLSPAHSAPSPQPLSHTSQPVSSISHNSQPVFSMEMWQEALKRTEKAMGKRELRVSTSPSSFSSFADLPPSWSCSSPSTSSSSSAATKAAGLNNTIEANAKIITNTISNTNNTPREAESRAPLLWGCCTGCANFVMVERKDHKCPGCQTEVVPTVVTPVVPSAKRQRV